MENGCDSDGEVGPFFDAVASEGSLELDEPTVPEVEDAVAEGTQQNNEDTEAGAENNEGKDITIDEATLLSLKVADLKKELQMRGQSTTGKKSILLDRLRETVHMPILSSADGQARARDDLKRFSPTARWKPLVPMAETVEEPQSQNGRFRAPTIPESEADFVPQKHDYAEVFDREVFEGRRSVPRTFANGRPRKDQNGKQIMDEVVREGGGPSLTFLKKHNLTIESHPADWFKAFLPIYDGRCSQQQAFKDCFTHKWAQYTNNKALLVGAGSKGSMYPSFSGFSYRDIEKHLSLYMMQGLNPSPQVEQKISSQTDDPVGGNDLVYSSFGGEIGVRRHKEFKSFFCIQDPKKVAPSRSARPNYKVDPLLRWIQEISMQAWELGVDISTDEQTIGFQGRHINKLRITYKNEGDGFHCDALCKCGFTYTFYFRNQPAPRKYLEQGLSPLHFRIMVMFDQVKNKSHNMWFDNL